ncbi:hypothetical protein SteCoe_11409 [Stentor coeruleus]|uniref:HECT-type E3 ubiquitin transferase n=1 Tax=Stentor coeruleus TaxID=5963 RepID=A0A1R2CD60_9CILI|nr:hypothetical protein SteCoe_11409 [Stentor coeruleus]
MIEETKNTYEQLLKKAYIQMTVGCKRRMCLNPYCYSNPSFPNMSDQECKDYVLHLASTVEPQLLAKTSNFIFCTEPSYFKCHNGETSSSNSYSALLANTENLGVLFLYGTLDSQDPKIDWKEFLGFSAEIKGLIKQGALKDDFLVPILNELQISRYGKLYLPRGYLILLCLISELNLSLSTMGALCVSISVNSWMNEQLGLWVDSLPSEIFEKTIRKLQDTLTAKYQSLTTTSNYEEMIPILKTIGIINQSNSRKERVSYRIFYNQVINSTLSIQEEYRKWKIPTSNKRKMTPNQRFSFLDYSWVIDCTNKTKLLQHENYELIEQEFNQFLLISLLSGGFTSPYLNLEINREHMVEDTMQQINNKDINLKKPLRIKFIGEEGVDEGGVKKEFFQLIVKKLFEETTRMFVYIESKRLHWFSTSNDSKHYELLGTLLGLAIYNGVNLDLRFPMALYRKLQNVQTGFDDLKEFDDFTVQSLQKIIEFPGDIQTFCLNFIMDFDAWGQKMQAELIEGGRDLPVTNQNKYDFVKLYTNYILNVGVHDQFEAFKKGFLKICGGGLLKYLRPEELELILCGCPVFDLRDLERVAVYENGFTRESLTVNWLWGILHSLDIEQQKKFLFFVTGSDRAPINGLSSLHFVISRNGPDSDRLMTAHTCYNYLLLPEYNSEDKMRSLLLTAINNSEGFGLR